MKLERFTPESASNGELHAQHISRYDFASRYTGGKKIIDVACGTGYGASLLRQRGAASVVGIDLSQDAITHAREKYATDGLTFHRGDVSTLRDEGPADCIVSFETIEHLDDPEDLLAPARSVLGPDGLFIVSTPVRHGGALSDRPANPFHVREWNEKEFDALLAVHFPVRRFFFQYVYRKRPYPLSRTINRLALQLFLARQSEGFEEFPVIERPWEITAALIERGYMIAVCSGKGS